jgi:sulfur carrier protein
MNIIANGKARQVPDGLTVEMFLRHLALRVDSVAVERNGEALTRSELPSSRLEEGDRLEIVKAVAGG